MKNSIRETRRDAILSAAQTLFKTTGYAQASIAKIAAAANVTPPTLYNYFYSKDGILISLMEREDRKIAERLAKLGAQDFATAAAGLYAALVMINDDSLKFFDRGSWAQTRIYYITDNPNSKKITKALDSIYLHVRRLVDEFMKQNKLSTKCNPAQLTIALRRINRNCFEDIIGHRLTRAEYRKELKEHLWFITHPF